MKPPAIETLVKAKPIATYTGVVAFVTQNGVTHAELNVVSHPHCPPGPIRTSRVVNRKDMAEYDMFETLNTLYCKVTPTSTEEHLEKA